MKRRMLLFICIILLSTTSSMAENNIIVKSGDILVFSKKGSANVTFDYSKTEVNDTSLEEFIDEKGEEEYKEDWNRWIREAERMFIENFNKKSKGLQLKRGKKTEADYNIVVKVKTIDTGNTAQGFLPTFSLKIRNGAPAMNGTMFVKDKEGKNICTLTLKNVYGLTGLNVSTRLITLYMELSKKIRKTVNNAVKEDLKRQKEEMGTPEDDDEEEDDEDESDEEEDDEDNEDSKNDKANQKDDDDTENDDEDESDDEEDDDEDDE